MPLSLRGLIFPSTQQHQKFPPAAPLSMSPFSNEYICGIPIEHAALSATCGRSHMFSANFRLYRKARRLIFPVLICVISALSGFLTLCSCKTLVLGLGAKARSSLTLPPSLCTVLIAALRGTVPRT